MNTDGSPTKTEVLRMRREEGVDKYWRWSFGKRPEEELYDISRDPDCITDLAGDPGHEAVRRSLREQLERELTEQEDPRMTGGAPLDENPLADPSGNRRGYYERFMAGDMETAGWITPTDIDAELAED